jgi:hypothetical protein
MKAEIWATVGTILGMILFLIVGVAYAYYVLKGSIGSTQRAPVRLHGAR